MRLHVNLFQPTIAGAPRRITQMNRNAPVFRRLRSSATKEQLREYFEVRFRAEKYGVPYFLAESEAIALRPTEKGRRSKLLKFPFSEATPRSLQMTTHWNFSRTRHTSLFAGSFMAQQEAADFKFLCRNRSFLKSATRAEVRHSY